MPNEQLELYDSAFSKSLRVRAGLGRPMDSRCPRVDPEAPPMSPKLSQSKTSCGYTPLLGMELHRTNLWLSLSTMSMPNGSAIWDLGTRDVAPCLQRTKVRLT